MEAGKAVVGQRAAGTDGARGVGAQASPGDGPGTGGGRLRAWLRALAVALCAIVADQVTKALVRGSVAAGSERKLIPGLALVHTENRGVAFGLDPGSTAAVIAVVAAVLAILALYFARRAGERLYWLPTGLIFGGAIGNLVDRLREGAVTDFIKLPLGWPPFNVADACITVAVLLLAALIALGGEPRRGNGPQERVPGGPGADG